MQSKCFISRNLCVRSDKTSQLPKSLFPAMNYWVCINTVNKVLGLCFARVVIILEPAMYDHSVEPGTICLKIFLLILCFSFAMQKKEEEGNIYLCIFHIYIRIYLYRI